MDYNQKLSRSFNAQPIPLTLITKNNQIIYRKEVSILEMKLKLKILLSR